MKRFHAQEISPVHGVCIVDDPHGEYVRHSDAEAEIAKLTQDRDRYAQLTERMKCALRKPGTEGSYVEWAAECRDAVDKLKDAQAEIERLRGLVRDAWVEGYCAALPETPNRDCLGELTKWAAASFTYLQALLSTETPDESK